MTAMNKTRLIPCGLAVSAVLLGACEDTGNLTLGLSDAPLDDAGQAVIEIEAVELQPAGGDRVTIDLDPVAAVDLLALGPGERAVLVEAEPVLEGLYSSLRLRVNAERDGELDSFVTAGGASLELCLTDRGEDLLRIDEPFEIVLDEDLDLTVDIDLRRSVRESGVVECLDLEPVFRLVETGETGSIGGTVDPTLLAGDGCIPDLGAVQVYVFAGPGITPDDLDGVAPEPVASVRVALDEGGAFGYRAGFLEPNAYTLALTCEADLDRLEEDDELSFEAVAGARVRAGEDTTLDF